MGSIDRFIAYLIEETKGAFPVWLAPVQVRFLPVTDRANSYCENYSEFLKEKGFRVELDDRNEKIGKKIREAQLEKIPYMIIVGDEDIKNNTHN